MIHCPFCHKAFDVALDEVKRQDIRLLCDHCHKLFGATELGQHAKGAPAQQHAASPNTLLVVHDNEAVFEVVDKIVTRAGWTTLWVKQANQAQQCYREALQQGRSVSMALLDVAARDLLVYELVEQLRVVERVQSGPDQSLRIVLLASVYDRTAYKRTPKTLHGADDYLEQHHVPDKLPELMRAVASKRAGEASVAVDDAQLVEARALLQKAAGESTADVGKDAGASALDRCRTLARRLVLDISLYNEEAFIEGLRKGDLRDTLSAPIAAAKLFLGEKLAAGDGKSEDRQASRFIEEALDELVRAKGVGHERR